MYIVRRKQTLKGKQMSNVVSINKNKPQVLTENLDKVFASLTKINKLMKELKAMKGTNNGN